MVDRGRRLALVSLNHKSEVTEGLVKDMFVSDSHPYNPTFGGGTNGFIVQSFILLQNELEESFNLENLLVGLRFKRQATKLKLI